MSSSTLRKIRVSEARVGMHLHKIEGSWTSHAFWKTRFVIEDETDLVKLRESGALECWIDAALGLDLAAAQAPEEAVPRACTAPACTAPAARRARPEGRGFGEELQQAAAICERGRQAVKEMLGEVRLGRTVDAERFRPLVREVSDSVLRNPGAIVSLARLKTLDDYSYLHSVAVCALMIALARQMGLGDEACREAGEAGLMHDIGKAFIPSEVLNKPGRLDAAEMAIVRTHPARGHELLRQAGNTPSTLDVVLHHHERIDGAGYPEGLAGAQISQIARMGAICDVYDAITSNRPYKQGWDPAEALARMATWKGQFDETIFSSFVHSLGIYPTGSLVRLASGRLAVVVEQNPKKLLAPVVCVFYSTKSQMHLVPERLNLARSTDRILAREARFEDAEETEQRFPHLDEYWVKPEVLARMRR